MPNPRRYLSPRWLLAFLGGAVLLCGLAMLHPYLRQSLFGPTIRGKPWCVWEGEVRRNFKQADHEQSFLAKTIRWLGVKHAEMEVNDLFNHAEMAPLLLHLAEDRDPVIRRGAVSAFYWHKELQVEAALPTLRARLDDADLRCRIEATMAVASIDPDARVLPVLLRILDDPRGEDREKAMRSEDHDEYMRYLAVRAVSYLACVDDAAFDVMLRHAKDRDSSIREAIMDELCRHGKKGVPTLLLGLADENPNIRLAAAQTLGTLGADAKPAVPALERLFTDNDLSVRTAAVTAVAVIAPERLESEKAKEK